MQPFHSLNSTPLNTKALNASSETVSVAGTLVGTGNMNGDGILFYFGQYPIVITTWDDAVGLSPNTIQISDWNL